MADAIALRKAFHIRIDSKQDRIIGECRRANDIIPNSFWQRLTIEDDEVSALFQRFADRIRNSRVKKNA